MEEHSSLEIEEMIPRTPQFSENQRILLWVYIASVLFWTLGIVTGYYMVKDCDNRNLKCHGIHTELDSE